MWKAGDGNIRETTGERRIQIRRIQPESRHMIHAGGGMGRLRSKKNRRKAECGNTEKNPTKKMNGAQQTAGKKAGKEQMQKQHKANDDNGRMAGDATSGDTQNLPSLYELPGDGSGIKDGAGTLMEERKRAS